MTVVLEKREFAAVAWMKGLSHIHYEDSFRMISRDIRLVETAARGEIFAVFDGIGSAKLGRHSAQVMAECLTDCFRNPLVILKDREGLYTFLYDVNMKIEALESNQPGAMSDVGCVGTILWIVEDMMHIFHAGDTSAVLVKENDKKILTTPHQTETGGVTRYFGQGATFKMDVASIPITEGDRIYLMSDGVSKVIDPVAAALSMDDMSHTSEASRIIAEKAVRLGSTDDITVLCVDVEEIWESEK